MLPGPCVGCTRSLGLRLPYALRGHSLLGGEFPMGTVGRCELPPLVTSSCPEVVSPCPRAQARRRPSVQENHPSQSCLVHGPSLCVCHYGAGTPKANTSHLRRTENFSPVSTYDVKNQYVGMFRKTQVLHLGAGSSAPAWQRQVLGCRGVGAPDVHGAVLSNRTRGTMTLG